MAEVISEQQKALNQALHQQNDQFGNRDDAADLQNDLELQYNECMRWVNVILCWIAEPGKEN